MHACLLEGGNARLASIIAVAAAGRFIVAAERLFDRSRAR